MLARLTVAVAIVAVAGTMTADAQGARDPYVPAEMPPASFSGEQYVDSTGCAFIRAGFSGQTNWVPRFDRERNPVCGLTPSVGGEPAVAAAPEPAPTPPPAPAPERVAVPPAPAQTVPRVAAARIAPRAAPPAHAPQAVRPAAPAYVVSGPLTYCPNYDAIGQQHTRVDGREALRCGPQAVHPSDGLRTSGDGVWQPHGGARAIPEGYRLAWDDDRLNPNRGRGTVSGQAQMHRIWTNTVPMQLIDPQGPSTVPYGLAIPAPKAHVSTRGAAVRQTPPVAAPPAAAPAATGHRFVQVGSFGVPENARGTVQRFQAMGWPVRTAQLRSGGRVLDVVMIGPFSTQDDLAAALRAARQAGFGDAFTRG